MEPLSSTFELLEPVSSSSDSDVSIIRKKESGEFFLLKSLKNRPESEKGGLDRRIRFKREMDIVLSLDHPNIAKPSFSLGGESGESIAYPFRKGKTLSRQLSDGPAIFPIEALHFTLQLLSALEYIHSRGIIHCDINPNNLYIDDSKGLQLLDFGMSMTEDEAAAMPEGHIMGTMPWLSPEQMGFTGFKIDTRSDLYCTALILYRMLAGTLPFELENNTLEELCNKALRTEVLPVRKVPSPLNAILLKSLKPTPSDRYQTAAGLKHDLSLAVEAVKNEHHEAFVPGQQDTIIAVNRSRLFVARSREVESLKDGLHQFLQGRPASYCIYGKSGMGKTEIVREFKRAMPEERFFFISSKCNSFTSRQPYSIYRHTVLEFIAKINSGTREQMTAFSNAVEQQLLDYSGVICKMVPEMRPFFKQVKPIDLVEPEKETDRTAHVLFTLVSTLCSFKPLVIFIDDLQWIDRVSFEIIRRLIKNSTVCMIVTAFRTDKYEAELSVFEFDLRRVGVQKFLPAMSFTRGEIKDFIISRFGKVADATGLVDLLVAKTDCSPFALSQAFRFLVNNGFLSEEGDGWSLAKINPEDLPEKLDPIALILDKIKDLNPEELKWLETASLAEGRFKSLLVESVGGFSPAQSSIIIENLETTGFLVPLFGGGYRFAHDHIQESVRNQLAKERQLNLYEKFGCVYETMAEVDKEYLFNAAESYLKSKNLAKAIELCYKAAKHATDTVALDIASRYFTKTQLMVSQCSKVGVKPVIDVIKMQIEFGDVLMLLGRNEQALRMFEKLIAGYVELPRPTQIDIKYKIGTIFHNMGDFDKSVSNFTDALGQLNVRLYANKFLLLGSLLIEICKQILLSCGLNKIIPKTNAIEKLLSVKILNRLSFSLYYRNVIPGQLAHFKAINTADRLIECPEKAEAYTYHIVSSFVFLMKKRAFTYFRKAIEISKKINRKDTLALAHTFGGVTYSYNGSWKNAGNHIDECNSLYKSIGDRWGQIIPLETKVLLSIQMGAFDRAKNLIADLAIIDNECNDRRGLALSHHLLTQIKHLEGKDSYLDWATVIEERDSVLSKSPMNKTMSNLTIETKFILENQLKSAFDISDVISYDIKRNNLFHEYVSSAFSDRCEILIREYYNRYYAKEPEKQLSLSDRELFRELRKYMRSALLRGIMYPAHLGAAWRSLAWFHAFKKSNRIARYFFTKAISHHHRLDMKYEEAKSLRDFGLFYEERHQPGLARDCFNQAYALFEGCGAALETGRLEDKVDPDLLRPKARRPEERDTSTGTFDAADQIRVDTLYSASLSLSHAGAIDDLLHQVVHSLIKATGAQFGLLHLDGDEFHESRELVLNFENQLLARDAVQFSSRIIDMARRDRTVIVSRDAAGSQVYENSAGKTGSALCVPLLRGDKYFGCVYLTNTLVAGLFSEGSVKAAQIIAAQAGFYLENAWLMEEYKRLNERLEQKVKEQTHDIRDKNDQLHNANLRLVESERMKDLLSGTIVHDIKNFAAGISGHLKLLEYKYKEDRRTMRSIDLVTESCTDIVSLASNLLDINKMEEGRLSLQQRRLYFEEVGAMAQKFGRNVLFDEKKITVTIVPAAGDFAVLADPYLIERVIQNLFSNAAKYTDAGGRVALAFEETGAESIVSFTSSGPLIPDDQKQIIFEKYGRVDGKSSQYSKGLGLFFCRMVMTAHQGRIWLETDEQGNHFKMGFRKI